jgi:hypothetical protein
VKTRELDDLVVVLCGLVTCTVTAIILWGVEQVTDVALYTYMLWWCIPIGAIIAGLAGGSGYYAGAWNFGYRPSKLLLVNTVLASVGTFFLIHYLSYSTFVLDGHPVRDQATFVQYVDVATRSMSMQYSDAGKDQVTGELGALGYGVALLQIAGFALGGAFVYQMLATIPYCDRCARYFRATGKHIRYSETVTMALESNLQRVMEHLKKQEVAEAMALQRTLGAEKPRFTRSPLRSIIARRRCTRCGQHWTRYSVETPTGYNGAWAEVRWLTVAVFTPSAGALARSTA